MSRHLHDGRQTDESRSMLSKGMSAGILTFLMAAGIAAEAAPKGRRHAGLRPARRTPYDGPLHPRRQRLDLGDRAGLRHPHRGGCDRRGRRAGARRVLGGLRRRARLHLQAARRQVQQRRAGDGRGRRVLVSDRGPTRRHVRLPVRPGRVDRGGRRHARAIHPEGALLTAARVGLHLRRLGRSQGHLRGRSRAVRHLAGVQRRVQGRRVQARLPRDPQPQRALLGHRRGREPASLPRQGRAALRPGEQRTRARTPERRLRRHREPSLQPGHRGPGHVGHQRRGPARLPTGLRLPEPFEGPDRQPGRAPGHEPRGQPGGHPAGRVLRHRRDPQLLHAEDQLPLRRRGDDPVRHCQGQGAGGGLRV